MKEQEKHLVTIVVPVYNVAPYLERCMRSIVEQTYKNLEIILVDDGSNDGSAELCDKIEQKYLKERDLLGQHLSKIFLKASIHMLSVPERRLMVYGIMGNSLILQP